jgi:hypothetical protein
VRLLVGVTLSVVILGGAVGMLVYMRLGKWP